MNPELNSDGTKALTRTAEGQLAREVMVSRNAHDEAAHSRSESMAMSQQRDVRHFRYDAIGLRGRRMRLTDDLPTSDAATYRKPGSVSPMSSTSTTPQT